jgi:thymidylate synthase (FAD)
VTATPVTPEVYIVGQTDLNFKAIEDYLDLLGVDDAWWFSDPTNRTAEDMLIELMGRLCYRSFGTHLNPNITRIREDPAQYIGNLISSEHGSVLEHASVNFVFRNVSRVFTHELVRHRAGTAFSQESLRYVRLEDFGYILPQVWQEDQKVAAFMQEKMDLMSGWQKELAQMLDLDSMGFDKKKAHTSAMRRLAPIGLATSIGFTANIRALRWIIQMRTNRGAEEEIRTVFSEVGRLCKEKWPLLFADFAQNDSNEWVTDHGKI